MECGDNRNDVLVAAVVRWSDASSGVGSRSLEGAQMVGIWLRDSLVAPQHDRKQSAVCTGGGLLAREHARRRGWVAGGAQGPSV
jgi:hypothetical protein